MKQHYQTKWKEGKGNCFQYAVASILELEPEDVPDFCNEYNETDTQWHEEFSKWLRQFGLSAISVEPLSKKLDAYYYKDCTLLVCVKNDDGVNHAAIYKNGKLIHDPNFWYEGKYKVVSVDIIFPINPASCIRNREEVKD
jgi:hypothetical protein